MANEQAGIAVGHVGTSFHGSCVLDNSKAWAEEDMSDDKDVNYLISQTADIERSEYGLFKPVKEKYGEDFAHAFFDVLRTKEKLLKGEPIDGTDVNLIIIDFMFVLSKKIMDNKDNSNNA